MKFFKIELPASLDDQSSIPNRDKLTKRSVLGHVFVLSLCLHVGPSTAQAVNIKNYCAEMANARFPTNASARFDYEQSCVGTLEVQRKYRLEKERADERDKQHSQEFEKLRGKTDLWFATREQQEKVIKAANSPAMEIEITKLKKLIKACPRFEPQEDCDETRNEAEQSVYKATNIRIDLR